MNDKGKPKPFANGKPLLEHGVKGVGIGSFFFIKTAAPSLFA